MPDRPDTAIAATRWLDRSEGRVAFECAGHGPLVVCVPGMGQTRRVFDPTADLLRRAGFRVGAMDLRGHGDSDATFGAYDDVAAAGDAAAVVREMGGPAVVVGSSMGAAAAVLVAAEHPDLVRALVLVGPFVRDAPVGRALALAWRLVTGGPWARAAWLAYLPKLYPGRAPADLAEQRAAIAQSMRRPGHTAAFRRTARTSHAAAEARLDDVQAPVLVVMGTADPDFADPDGEARWIGDRLGAEVLAVPGAGHYPHHERPELVGPAVVAFARQACARA